MVVVTRYSLLVRSYALLLVTGSFIGPRDWSRLCLPIGLKHPSTTRLSIFFCFFAPAHRGSTIRSYSLLRVYLLLLSRRASCLTIYVFILYKYGVTYVSYSVCSYIKHFSEAKVRQVKPNPRLPFFYIAANSSLT